MKTQEDKSIIDDNDIIFWRYAYWLERNLLKELRRRKRSQKDRKCYKVLNDYYHTVNNKIFFTETITQRLYELYNAFMECPHISAKCGYEEYNGDFEDHTKVPRKIYEDSFFRCMFTDIQISTYIEHRARLAILKNAVDYILYEKVGEEDKTKDISLVLVDDREVTLWDCLPDRFKDGLEKISKHKYFYRYPIFWQWFMWVFGGFILKDYEKKEYELLSQKTGIPPDEIPKALEAYQILFPSEGGWIKDLQDLNSNVKIITMFPVPFIGIGANYRRYIYTDSKKFEDLKLSGEHTLVTLLNGTI